MKRTTGFILIIFTLGVGMIFPAYAIPSVDVSGTNNPNVTPGPTATNDTLTTLEDLEAMSSSLVGTTDSAPSKAGPGLVNLDIRPTETAVRPSGNQTVEFVVEWAEGGVVGYNLTFALSDTTDATFVSASTTKPPQFGTGATIWDNGDRVNFQAALGDNTHPPDTEIVIARATIDISENATEGNQSTVFTDEITALGGDGVSYDVQRMDDSTLVVSNSTAEASLGLEPSSPGLLPNQTQTYDLVLENTTSTVDSYNLSLEIANDTIAAFEELEVVVGNDTGNSSIGSGNGTVVIDAEDVGAVTNDTLLASVRARAGENITEAITRIDYANSSVTNATGDSYPAIATEGADLSVFADPVTVSAETSVPSAFQGEVVTYDIVVEDAFRGIGSFDMEFAVDGADGSFVNYTLNNASVESSNFSPDGSTLSVNVPMVTSDFTWSGPHTVATVDVTTGSMGNLSVTPINSTIGTATGATYPTTHNGSSNISIVQGLDPLPGYTRSPRDTVGDGRLNDADGDGEFDVFDVQAFFNGYESGVVQNNTGLFNFDGEPGVDVFDVQALFDRLRS